MQRGVQESIQKRIQDFIQGFAKSSSRPSPKGSGQGHRALSPPFKSIKAVREVQEARAVRAAQRATQKTNTSLRDLLRKSEEIVAVLDETSRELDNIEARLRRCSWKLAGLKDEAMKVEEAEGVSLRKARLDKASDLLSRVSARLLKLSEMVDKACFEVKAFTIEGSRVAREVQGRAREEA
jgi:seryl-tRNA synthetase